MLDTERRGLEHFNTTSRLHTEVLEDKYGEIHADVLRHDDVRVVHGATEPIREAHLCDVLNISQTWALTFLTYPPENDELYEIDQQIRAGGKIGQVFKGAGFIVRKNVLDVFVMPITEDIQRRFQQEERFAKARISEFYARRAAEQPLIYGRVLEAYCSDFRPPMVNSIDIDQVNPSTDIMGNYGISRLDIWDHLDRASEQNEWADRQEAYERARIESLPEVFAWRDKVTAYLRQK